MQLKSIRVFYLDLIKGLTIPLVIILHVSAVGISELQIGSFSWQVCNIYDSLVRFTVPIFCMVSGVLFLDSNKPVHVWKSVKRLLIPLIFWSLVYSFGVTICKSHHIDKSWFNEFLTLAFVTPTHTWFLYMLISLYIITPLLRCVSKNKSTEEYYIALWLIFGVILPSLEIIPVVSQVIRGISSKMYMYLPMGYSGYFVLGHYLHTYYLPNKRNSLPFIFVIINLSGLIMWITSMMSANGNLFNGWAYEYLNPIVAVISSLVFLVARNLGEAIKSSRVKMYITTMSYFSLGIYLLHIPVMILLRKLGFDYNFGSPVIAIPIVSLVIYILTYIIVLMISKVPYLKKYII